VTTHIFDATIIEETYDFSGQYTYTFTPRQIALVLEGDQPNLTYSVEPMSGFQGLVANMKIRINDTFYSGNPSFGSVVWQDGTITRTSHYLALETYPEVPPFGFGGPLALIHLGGDPLPLAAFTEYGSSYDFYVPPIAASGFGPNTAINPALLAGWLSSTENDVLPAGEVSLPGLWRGGVGHDSISDNEDPSSLYGDAGNDVLSGGAGNDSLHGGEGDDWLTPGNDPDSIDGGPGTDMLSLVDLAQRAVVDMGAGTAVSGTDTDRFTGIENLTGTIFADHITGNAGANRLRGLGDYDWFVGSGGGDTFEGGTGRDMVSYATATAGVTVDLVANRGTRGQALGDSYTGIERITGSSFADTLYGGIGEEDLRGLGGDDLMFGSAGGRERFDGGAGRDTVSYDKSFGIITSTGIAGVDASLLLGRGSGNFAGRDLYTSIENLTGSLYDDRLTGDHGANTLIGSQGDDFLFGNGGNDRLAGGFYNDSIDGGAGLDTAVFLHARSSYALATAAGVTTVTLILGPHAGEVDTLVNIEVLAFADQTLIL